MQTNENDQRDEKTKIRREFRETGNICERQEAYVCTRARRKWQNPCVERERERGSGRVYTYMIEGETSRG